MGKARDWMGIWAHVVRSCEKRHTIGIAVEVGTKPRHDVDVSFTGGCVFFRCQAERSHQIGST